MDRFLLMICTMEDTTKNQQDVQAATAKKKKKHRGLKVFLAFLIVGGGFYLWQFEYKNNFQEVIEDTLYRSAQPETGQLKDWIEQYKIQTVLNLRGDAGEETDQEEALLQELGVKMVTVELSAYRMPGRESLLDVIDALNDNETPMLIHCRQGMDRSGTVGAIARMLLNGEGYDSAKWEAYIPEGPWKRKKHTDYEHISDLFDLYEDYCQELDLDRDDPVVFFTWVQEVYGRQAGE